MPEPDDNKKAPLVDFDDVVAAPEEVEPPKEEKTIKRKSGIYDYMLCAKVENGFIQFNLRDCTGEAFLSWLDTVYPGTGRKSSDFEDKEKRLTAFKNVVKNLQRELAWLRESPRINKSQLD